MSKSVDDFLKDIDIADLLSDDDEPPKKKQKTWRRRLSPTPEITVHARDDNAEELPIPERPHELNKHVARIFKLEEQGMAVRDCPHWKIVMVEYKYNPNVTHGFVDKNGFYQDNVQPQCWCTTKIRYVYTLSHKLIPNVYMEIGSSCMTHFDHTKIREKALTLRKRHNLKKEHTWVDCRKCGKELDNFRLSVQKDEGYCNDVCAGRVCEYRDCTLGIKRSKWLPLLQPQPHHRHIHGCDPIEIGEKDREYARWRGYFSHCFCCEAHYRMEVKKVLGEKLCRTCNELFVPKQGKRWAKQCTPCWQKAQPMKKCACMCGCKKEVKYGKCRYCYTSRGRCYEDGNGSTDCTRREWSPTPDDVSWKD